MDLIRRENWRETSEGEVVMTVAMSIISVSRWERVYWICRDS